ncbi:MAG TPA: cytochrome c [Candidatus Methanoperedens sp.]|nr:cytochrome c [Candidatus Methanoperedens sp.]
MKRTVARKPAVVLVMTLVAVALAGEARAQTAPVSDPYDSLAAGKASFEKVCSACHGLDRPNGKTLDAAGWGALVDRMKSNGAGVNDENRGKILGWLTAKSTFDTKCSDCHGTDRPLGKAKTRADWTATVQRMAGKKPGWVSDADAAAIAAYLAIVRPAP